MSALAFNLLRIGYLVLLWLFVLFAIGVLRRDLLTRARDGASEAVGGRKRRRKEQQISAPIAPEVAYVPAPAAAPAPAQVGGYQVGGVALPPGAPPPAGAAPVKAKKRQRAEPVPVPTELFVTAGSLTGTRVPLAETSVLIGRAPGSTLLITDDYASSRHARIFQQGGQWFLEDLDSTNGTFVAGQRVTGTIPLAVGNTVQIGQSMIELR